MAAAVDLSEVFKEYQTLLSEQCEKQFIKKEVWAAEEAEKGAEEEKEEPCCSLCRSSPRECACVECGAHTCRKCSRAIPSGKKHVWMCVPCAAKYPDLKPNARGPESQNHSEIPPNSRRRTSDSGVFPPSERTADAHSARGRSDSLPGGEQSPLRPQKPQTRQEPPNRHPPNGSPQFRLPRPDQPPSQQGVRPQQRPRPEQQRQPSKEQRPQRSVNSKQPQTGEMQRPHQPMDHRQSQMEDMQKSQHPVDFRPVQPEDMTRPQHLTEPRQNPTEAVQKLQHAADPRYTQPGDMQRPQHLVDLKQSHTLSIQRPQNPMDPRQPQPGDLQKLHHPMDPRQPQPGDLQKLHHPMDPRQPQPGDLQKLHHPMDPRQPQPGDIQRQHQPINPRQSQMGGDLQRPQHNIDPKQHQPGDSQRPQHTMNPRQLQPGDLQRPPHPMDLRQPQPGDLQRPQHPIDLQQHQSGELQRLQNPIEPRQFQTGDIQRLHHPTDPRQQRLPHPLDPKKHHSSDLKRLQNRDDLQKTSQANNNNNQLPNVSPRDSRPQPPAGLLSANNDPQRPGVENCHLPVEQHPNQYVDPSRTKAEHEDQVIPVDQTLQQPQKYTQELFQNQFIEVNKRFGLENDLDYAKTNSYHLNEYPKPKPQHPIVNPPTLQNHEDIPMCHLPDLPQQQQRSVAEKHLPPPKRNQRLREPVDQQAVPRPQHPQEPFPCEQQPKEETGGCSTNPFLRSAANNPFRRESLPEMVASQQLPCQRRGSLDERLRPEDQTSKMTENSNKISEKCSNQPHERDKSSNDEEQQRSEVPVPRARTSLPDPPPHLYAEGRNGIPRTVPLTSLAQTLEQQPGGEDPPEEEEGVDAGVLRMQRKGEGWRDDEEDYFEMIERAIARPRDIPGKSTVEMQEQLTGGGGRVECALDRAVSSLQEDRRIGDSDDERGGKTESLILHEPPPVKHYLEEHKTQPVSYEAFSSAKALQNGRKDESRSNPPPAYYYSQTAAASGGETTASDTKQPLNSDDWSPVSDLSPIADVSPSVEAAAEKELMEKFREKSADGVPRATSGTISGMLEEFNRALGLPPGGTSPVDDSEIKSAVSPLAISPVQKGYQQQQERQSSQKPLQQQQQQPTTPRRSHRRLPHPTVEQMQAAVAMAAQTPPPPSTTGAMLFSLDTKQPCPEQPQQSFEQVYNTQKQVGAQTAAVPSPAPRNQNKNSNSPAKNSESSQPNQEGAARRLRSFGGGVSGAAVEEERGGDPSSPLTPGTPRDKVAGDSPDTQSEAESVKSVRLRRKLPNLPATDQCSTPSPTRKNMDRGKSNGFGDFNGISSPPIPKGLENPKPLASLLAPSGGKTETSSVSPCGGSKLPEYMQSLKQQLRDELKAVTEERKAILEQRGNGPSSSADSGTEDSVSSAVSKSLATYQAQQSALLKQLQAQSPPHQSKTPSQASTPVSQNHSKTTYKGVLVSSPYRTHSPPSQQTGQLSQSEPLVQQIQLARTPLQSQPPIAYQSQLLQYQNQPQVIQYQTQPHIPYKAQVSYYGSGQELTAGQSVHESGRRTPQPMTPSRTGNGQDLSIYQSMCDLGRKTPQPMTPSRTGNGQDLSMYQSMCDLGRKTPQPMTPSRTGSGQDFSAFQTMYDSGRRTPQPMTPSRAGSNQDLTKYQTIYDSGRRTPQPMTPSKAGNSQDLFMYHQTMYDSGRKKSQPMTPFRTCSNQDLSANQTLYDMGRKTPQPMTPSRGGSSQDLTTYQVYDLGRRMSQVMTPSRAGSSQDLSMYQTVYDMGRRTLQTMTPSRAMSNQDLYRCISDSGGGRRTPLPDAVPRYTGRPGDGDDITVMTTATTTVVSASEWSGGSRRQTATTVAPSAAFVSGGVSAESLRRLQQPRMSPSPQKKGRRRHTSEIAMPPFAQIEHYAAAQQRTPPQPQYVQCYQVMTPTRPTPAFLRAVDFPSIESHARATDILLRSRGGTLLDTRAQHEGGSSDAYFQTLNSEINRLRRSSENLYRETMCEKQWTPQDTPQTTERRKRKEKKCRKPRSWHPSPYVSEDEDEQLTREEKKAKIKAEIARRRLQIEENMRLHDQLCRLSSERQEEEEAAGRCRATQQQQQQPAADDTSSVLKAIDEILRKDLYSGQKDYFQSGAGFHTGHTGPHRFGGGWYENEVEMQQQQQHGGGIVFHHQEAGGADPESAMDESIAAIASTFPTTPPPDILLSSSATPPMPLLPDMPTRSRKLLENLGAQSRSGSVQSLYQDTLQRTNESNEDRLSDSSLLQSQRKQQQQRTPVSSHKYEFPVKRILLTRDPKDRSVSGNGLGMRVVGGKEVPGSKGTLIGAYVAKIFPGGVVETLGEVKEGDQVLEWNGVPLTGRTYEEVQRIIASSADEVEIVIRCDLNMLEAMGGGRHPQQQQQRRSSPGGGGRGGGRQPLPESSGGGGGGGSPTRGGQPAPFGKRSSGEGGGNVLMGNNHMIIHAPPNNMIRASSYWQDTGFGEGVFAPGGHFLSDDWPELYEHFSSDNILEDEFENRWRHESSVEQVQLRVCPRATVAVYVPIARPTLKSALLDHRRCSLHDDDCADPHLQPPPLASSLSRLSLYLTGLLREKAAKQKREPRERPRAPSDLPGLRPIFVNEWKKTKTKGGCRGEEEETDDPNNNNPRSGGGSERSPEATPLFPKGCRGSFCVIL